MIRTLSILILALVGGWFSGDFVYSGGMGGLFLFLLLAVLWPVAIAMAAREFVPLLAALPGVAMSVRIAVINHLDPRFYNDLGENIRWGTGFSLAAIALSLIVSVPCTVRSRQSPERW